MKRFALLCLACLSVGSAHEWAEIDPAAALADADVALRITERFLEDPDALARPAEPPDVSGWPPELAWWTSLTAHLEAGGPAQRSRRFEILTEVATEWTGGAHAGGTEHLRWRLAMGELVAHAAARSITLDDLAAAEATLADPGVGASEAERASWILFLPKLDEDEARDLERVFERLDQLIEEGRP